MIIRGIAIPLKPLKHSINLTVKFRVLYHPFRDLGVTYTVYIWLVVKLIVVFLLMLIELFSPALTVEAL